MNNETTFEHFLQQQNEESWGAAMATLLRSIHEVDRNATQIWFSFYPLSLFRALTDAGDREKLVQQLLLQGDYDLKSQIDTSHQFLYGHRFWPQVKAAVVACAESFEVNNRAALADQILSVARIVAPQVKKDESLLVGITAVAFMTVQQTGMSEFKAAAGSMELDRKNAARPADQVVRERAKDEGRGLFGFLKTVNHEWTVTWDENDAGAKYRLREGQDLPAGASGMLRRRVEQHPDLTAGVREVGVPAPEHRGGARRPWGEADQDPHGGGLPRAVRPEETGHPAGFGPEGHVVHGGEAAVLLGQ